MQSNYQKDVFMESRFWELAVKVLNQEASPSEYSNFQKSIGTSKEVHQTIQQLNAIWNTRSQKSFHFDSNTAFQNLRIN